MSAMGDKRVEVVVVEDADGQLRISIDDDPTGAPDLLHLPPPHTDERPPRVRRLWVRNFKGFESFEVSFGTFNVLAGANNAGKSSLLQAIDLTYSLLKLHTEGPHLAKGRLVQPTILPVASGRDLFFRQVWRRANVYVDVVVGVEFSDASSVEFGLRYMFGNVNSRVLSHVGMGDERLLALLSRPSAWVPSAVGIVRDEEYRPPARQRGLISGGRHNEVLRNLLVDIRQNKPDRYAALQLVLSERFAGGIGSIEFDPELDQFVRGLYRSDAGIEHDLYSSGAGFLQILQMLAFIFAGEPSVVLLDEPDAHLHSSLQRVVVEILDDLSRKEGFQVLLATHSKEIINFVDPTRLILVEPGHTSASQIATEVTPIAVLKSLGAIDNVDAYTLVKNKRCLFLEGTSDATVFGRFAATLGLHVLTGDDRVVTVPVGGADRFEHVAQLDVFESLLGGGLSSLEVRDRDGRVPDYRDRLIQESTRPMHVLDLDAIESYLVKPSVIARVVSEILEERGRDGVPADANQIEELIIAATEEMRQGAEDRVAERLATDKWLWDRVHAPVPELNSTAREFIAANWSTLDERLRVLPGKRLLSRVRSEIQTTYGVNFGNERLAEAFLAVEIHPEITEVLNRIATL